MGHVGRREIALVVALAIVLAALGSRAEGQSVKISPLNTAEDLDLSGDIIYAINFGNSGNPKVGDVVFSQDQDYPGLVSVACSGEEPSVPSWYGVNPNTGDPDLDLLLGSGAWTNNGPGGCTTYVSLGGLHKAATYRLQLLFYETHTGEYRLYDITAGGYKIVELYDVLAHQGGVAGRGGSVLRYVFTAEDSLLKIEITPVPNNGNYLSSISGLILTELTKPTFADYGSGTTTELVSGKGTWQVNWGQGPWTWSDSEGESLFGSNVSSVLALQTTAAAAISEDLLVTLPIHGALTLSARDKSNGNVVIGTMSLSGTGLNIIDGNASRVPVNEGCGMFLAPFHPPGPELTMKLDDATGVFAYIQQAGDWRLQLAGLYAGPLMKGVGLQDNLWAALRGEVPFVGGLGQFELTGQYEADESKRPQRFCEYGTGIGLRFGAGGALWDQDWSGGPWTWHECPASVNATFLGDNVSGELETTTAGAPMIDQNLVLSFDFGGHISLTKSNEANADEVDGQILGDVDGVFVADLNAEHATIDADGNIVIAFGVSVNNAPDALITVTEATGVYADIRQAGQWAWYVNGSLAVTRLPDLTIQDNIMAALQNNDLILHAEEEFVLTGWYYRDSEGQ